jgi:hypothetical protein
MTQRPTPLPAPLEPQAPAHAFIPSTPASSAPLQEPLSPPSPTVPPQTPNPHAEPAQVAGTVSERVHAPLTPPVPTQEQEQPPSVDVQLLPHNQNGTGSFAVPAPDPNAPSPGLCPPPSGGRESGVMERCQPNGTASSQLSPSPADCYPAPKQAQEADPLHTPYMP